MEAFKIEMPPGAQKIINTLCRDGFEAYLVGGCVRDSLLGKIPKDWDICTNATPAEVERCFPEFRIIETGIQHGTVTILVNEESYEVTTFRTDGAYSDHRHPDEVKFTGSIEEDLARRDFTMNAIAYSPQRGLVDPYCGMYDLACGSIRCVGNPVERFQEDALRIMRALRFSSTYGFTMSTYTYQAAIDNLDILQHVARKEFVTNCASLCSAKTFSDRCTGIIRYSVS